MELEPLKRIQKIRDFLYKYDFYYAKQINNISPNPLSYLAPYTSGIALRACLVNISYRWSTVNGVGSKRGRVRERERERVHFGKKKFKNLLITQKTTKNIFLCFVF